MDERDYEELSDDEKVLNTLLDVGYLTNTDLNDLDNGQLNAIKEKLNTNKNRLNDIGEQSTQKIQSSSKWLIYHACLIIIQTICLIFFTTNPFSLFFIFLHIMFGTLNAVDILKLKEFKNVSKDNIELINDKIKDIQNVLEKRYIEEKKQEKIEIPEYMLNNRARYEYEEEQENIVQNNNQTM